MNKIYLLIVFIIFSFSSFGQSNENLKDVSSELIDSDFSSVFIGEKFKSYNRTDLYDRIEPIGFFGKSYQRFYIHFISVVQNKANPSEYFVYGKTKLKDNISSFQGTIKINKVEEYKRHEFPEFRRGELKGTYTFYEDPKNNGTGKFDGEVTSYWLINDKGDIEYDAMMLSADGYSNNQFNGEWISYSSNNKYICNWGDYRIPDSNELDNGAGEFFPSDEYLEKGWKSYLEQYGDPNIASTIESRRLEKQKWWIE